MAAAVLSSSWSMHAAQNLKPGENTLTFITSARQSGAQEVKWRLRAVETPPPYDLGKESFRVVVPKSNQPDVPHGLFIWINAGNRPAVPNDWLSVLAKRRLIFAGAHNSGNRRNIFDRIRLAVDLNHNLRGILNVDDRRVYVSGFSGGGRVASMVGVSYADMFSGAVCWMGANFYRAVKSPTGKWYRQGYIPDAEVLGIAKRNCRYVLVTGDKDFNLDNTLAVFHEGFRKGLFQHSELLQIPEHGHRLPAGNWLARALDLLEQAAKSTNPDPVSK